MHKRELLRVTPTRTRRDPKRAAAGQQGMQDRVVGRAAVPDGDVGTGRG